MVIQLSDGRSRPYARAKHAAGALPASLTRIAEPEAQMERTYRNSVKAQHAADATGIPHLSAMAEAAVGGLRAAPDEKTRAEAWQAMKKDERITDEVSAVQEAVRQRLGDDGVRAMSRSARGGTSIVAASVSLNQQDALDAVASVTVTMKANSRGAAFPQRQIEREIKRPGADCGCD